MRLQILSPKNVASAVFCARGEFGPQMHRQQQAWLEEGVLRGQVAQTDGGQTAGFILYYPIEKAPLEMVGEGFYAMQCLYVDPAQAGQGVGQGLIQAALADAKANGATGLAAEGFQLPPEETAGFDFMPKGFFVAQGFQEVVTRGSGSLLFLPVLSGAPPPDYLTPRFEPEVARHRLRVDLFLNGRCFAELENCAALRRAADSLGPRVALFEHDQNRREAVLEMGLAVGVMIDGELIPPGPPLSEEAARAELLRRLTQKGIAV